MAKQKTISKEITIKGKGLHSGLEVTMMLKPVDAGHGIKFQRIDLEEKTVIAATADNVTETSRGTTIESNGAKVSTIEHLMAALTAKGIDNLLIEINASEVPIIDGSAKPYMDALSEVGTKDLDAERITFAIKEKIKYSDEEKGIEIIAYPDDEYSLSVLVDYDSQLVKNQFAELDNLEDFDKEISPCRTFCFYSELEPLLKNANLIKGGEINNAVVIIDKDLTQEELDKTLEMFKQPKVDIKKVGSFVSNPELYFNNEPARHKLLDLVGDLSLVGYQFKGRIFARRPGHKANTEFSKILRNIIKQELQGNKAPAYDPNKKPLYDINDIKRLLPHRPPFLLIDKIIDMDDESIVGVKNVTMNEPFFVGHFPDEPVMPGVLMIEALAQTGGIFALSKVEDPENYLTYFMKIDKIKFRGKVVPGDTLIFKISLLTPIRRGIVHMGGTAFVGDNPVFEGEMMAQLAKIK
jgi:UDP-3-O-[3-hydroxymyristoyl] N-acetylglucosamine deacetylase/3-hydroxyacyl-[acyl-carrier-protein] dehydratase